MIQLPANTTPSPAAALAGSPALIPSSADAESPIPSTATTSSSAPASTPAAPRRLSSIPASELPPLAPLPTADPYSPLAVGQALFCSVFNLAFTALTAWLSSIPATLITQVRQTFSSPSQFQSSEIPLSNNPKSAIRNPQSLSERILLACRAFYRLLRVYHTFRCGAWAYLTPRQLGLLSRASQAIKVFSGQAIDFSLWSDLAGPASRSYAPPSDNPQSPQVAQSLCLPVSPSSASPRSALSSPPFPEWPFTAVTAYNAPFVSTPGSVLAQVCRDLARLMESPSPSPSCSQSELALFSQSCSQSQSIPSIESMGSTVSTPSTSPIAPAPHLPLAPASSVDSSPSLQVSSSSSVAPSPLHPIALSSSVPQSPCPQVPESSSLVSLVLYPGPLYSYPHILRPPYLTPPCRPPFRPYRPAHSTNSTRTPHPAHPPPS